MSDTGIRQRLAAILAADVAGYSRLMSADERATVTALDTARAVFRAHIASNQGRVIDMAGDSVMAVFETATGAVVAALAVQAELTTLIADVPEDRRMRFRIGVHLGDVIEKADGTIYGDGVNIAARLEGLAEPGGITVSESIYTAVRGKVGAEFENQGEQSIKNIPHPVRAYRVSPEGAATSATTTASPSTPGVVDLSLPDKPSIAVLPFANMSGDPEQEYFTDGITEDIITELSRFHSLFVIARNSTFTYKEKAVDVRTVGKELGVRYVLEGSIRRANNRIRVTAQLIDALTGNHIWADRYDRVLEDIFAVQEELTESIVRAIAPQIEASEREKARRRRPESLSAYEISVRAYATTWEAFHKADVKLRDQAIHEAREALAIDPRSTLALNAIALAQWQHVMFRTAPNILTAWNEGMAAAIKSTELDPSNSHAFTCKGLLLVLARDKDRMAEALAAMHTAFELNPNDIAVLGALGWATAVAGDPERGIEYLLQALRTSPRDPFRFRVKINLAVAHLLSKDYAKALKYALLADAEAPNGVASLHLASSYAGLGDMGKARDALETARRFMPGAVQSALDGQTVYRLPEHRQLMTALVRIAAGLEDPSAAEAFR